MNVRRRRDKNSKRKYMWVVCSKRSCSCLRISQELAASRTCTKRLTVKKCCNVQSMYNLKMLAVQEYDQAESGGWCLDMCSVEEPTAHPLQVCAISRKEGEMNSSQKSWEEGIKPPVA